MLLAMVTACKEETIADVEPNTKSFNYVALGKNSWKVVTTNTSSVNGFNINQSIAYFFADSSCYFINQAGNQLIEQYRIADKEVWFKNIGGSGNNNSEWVVWNVSVYTEHELILSLKNANPEVQIKMKAE
jgi:hypothetical protein